MDVHVDGRITRRLRARDCDILTSQGDGTREWPDPAVLDRATLLGRVLFTQDRDFLKEATMRQRQGVTFPGIIFAAQHSGSVDQLATDLELIAKAADASELADRIEYIPFPSRA